MDIQTVVAVSGKGPGYPTLAHNEQAAQSEPEPGRAEPGVRAVRLRARFAQHERCPELGGPGPGKSDEPGTTREPFVCADRSLWTRIGDGISNSKSMIGTRPQSGTNGSGT